MSNVREKGVPTLSTASKLLDGLLPAVRGKMPVVSMQQLALLLLLDKSKQKLGTAEIAAILNRQKYSIVRDCDALEQHGFVRRIDLPENRKFREVALLPAGRTYVRTIVAPLELQAAA